MPDPAVQEPTDAIVRVTTTALCGSDLHLYEVLGMFIEEGDILGHEPMGVEEVGPEVPNLSPGDRVVLPFQISCGHCWMCGQGLQTQRETTQVPEYDKGAALFGYTKLYGEVDGGQADPIPMLKIFDKQLQLRMGQANVKHWVDGIMSLLTGDGAPPGVDGFHAHQLPLDEAPHGYEIFQKKEDGAIKVLLKP